MNDMNIPPKYCDCHICAMAEEELHKLDIALSWVDPKYGEPFIMEYKDAKKLMFDKSPKMDRRKTIIDVFVEVVKEKKHYLHQVVKYLDGDVIEIYRRPYLDVAGSSHKELVSKIHDHKLYAKLMNWNLPEHELKSLFASDEFKNAEMLRQKILHGAKALH